MHGNPSKFSNLLNIFHVFHGCAGSRKDKSDDRIAIAARLPFRRLPPYS
jgi:hypothetical protein